MKRYALPLLLLAAVACADNARPAAAPTTASPPVSPTVTATASPTPSASVSPASATLAPGAMARYFRSPTGNIGCAIETTAAACDIFEKRWKPTPKPATCESDWGMGVYVSSNPPAKGQFSCAGDTVHNAQAPALPYGESLSLNGFTCESRRDGMRCVQVASGHGFFIGRDRYDLF
jgi:hypothetical protein